MWSKWTVQPPPLRLVEGGPVSLFYIDWRTRIYTLFPPYFYSQWILAISSAIQGMLALIAVLLPTATLCLSTMLVAEWSFIPLLNCSCQQFLWCMGRIWSYIGYILCRSLLFILYISWPYLGCFLTTPMAYSGKSWAYIENTFDRFLVYHRLKFDLVQGL